MFLPGLNLLISKKIGMLLWIPEIRFGIFQGDPGKKGDNMAKGLIISMDEQIYSTNGLII